jgi:transglutaminase-like putative cysteine protease
MRLTPLPSKKIARRGGGKSGRQADRTVRFRVKERCPIDGEMKGGTMRVRAGYEILYDFPQPTPMMVMLSIHHQHVSDLIVPDQLVTDPMVPIETYRDGFGNWCSRLVAPAGRLKLTSDAIVRCSEEPDEYVPTAQQYPVEILSAETLVYLLGSRYCETDRLSQTAWDLFGKSPTGWGRVQAICDYVHNAIKFDYEKAYPTKSAINVWDERTGVCRDFAHLAITFCRAMNIPARYCTGYLGDMGVPPPYGPMDFAAWMEVYLDGRWFTFDPRNNVRRIGRILIARGRDASDVPITHTFGFNTLAGFKVWTDEVTDDQKTGAVA